jgi:predicted O-methyltransferase YrrM
MIRALGKRLHGWLPSPVWGSLYFAYLLVEDWPARRFFPQWLRSFRQQSVKDGLPWLPFALIEWLDAYLTPSMSVFEYGSGGTTIWFAPRVRQVVSVEHHPEWHQAVSAELQRRGVTNVVYQLHEGAISQAPVYWDNWGDYNERDFTDYVRAIDGYPDHSFDLVLVDGRARKFCIEHAIRKVKPGGYLVVDNATSAQMAGFYGPLAPYRQVNWNSVAPRWPPHKWQASGWQIG